MAQKVTVQYLPDYTYSQLMTAGQHSFVADEPEANGGNDLGPTPPELLLWALGSCTAMTLLMYARRKGWDLADISVHLTRDRVEASELEASEADTSKVDLIQQDISVRGNLSEEQQQRLLEIARRCPVHRSLTSPTKIVESIIVGA